MRCSIKENLQYSLSFHYLCYIEKYITISFKENLLLKNPGLDNPMKVQKKPQDFLPMLPSSDLGRIGGKIRSTLLSLCSCSLGDEGRQIGHSIDPTLVRIFRLPLLYRSPPPLGKASNLAGLRKFRVDS